VGNRSYVIRCKTQHGKEAFVDIGEQRRTIHVEPIADPDAPPLPEPPDPERLPEAQPLLPSSPEPDPVAVP
jgi:hypothetical protein